MLSSGASQDAKRPLFINRVITSHLLELGYPQKSIDSMNKCGQSTGFSVLRSCGCKNEIICIKHHCSLRICPECAKRRARKIRRQYKHFLESLAQNRTYFIYFLTISPKNYENLDFGLKDIKKSFSKFLRHDYIKESVMGGFYVIETKGGEGNWNVHIHALIYGRWLDNKVRKEKDSKIVRLFKQSSKGDVHMYIQRQNSALFSLNYMCKYISANKDEFNSDKDVAIYINSTRKHRLINSFGLFYKLKIKKSPFICKECGQEVHFSIDKELFCNTNNRFSPPPPPQRLLYEKNDYLLSKKVLSQYNKIKKNIIRPKIMLNRLQKRKLRERKKKWKGCQKRF